MTLRNLTFLVLFLFSHSIMAQTPTEVQKNYSASGVFEYETIRTPNENRNQAILDSIQQAQAAAQWQAWFDKNEDKIKAASETLRMDCSTDQATLIAIYNATNGPNWNTSWDLSQPMDTWHGVVLNSSGCVIELYLDNNGLTGTIPAEVGDLEALISLALNHNQLSGTIPSTFANLTNLLSLQLQGNLLNGEIPAMLSSLTNLVDLSLNYNQFTGEIPASFGNLTNLEFLRINGNQLTGSLSNWIGGMLFLKVLEVGNNQLTGGLPIELSLLIDLQVLDVSGLGITTFPTWLGGLNNLTFLNISYNMLSGDIPNELSNLVNLEHLSLGGNQLTGVLPAWLGNFSNLLFLNVIDNQLSGFDPMLGVIPNLNTLWIGYNKFDNLDNIATNFPMLSYFDVFENHLTFENLLPHSSLLSNSYQYSPQKKFGTSTSVTVTEGDNHTVSFIIDPNITDNTYHWYRNDVLVTTTTVPTLNLTNLTLSTAGVYHCEVTNPAFPELRIASEDALINMILPAIPPNDMCADAIVLPMGNFSCTNATTGFNEGATNSNNDVPPPIPIDYPSSEDVWYQFTVPATGVFGFDLKSVSFDTYSACFTMYAGDCGNLVEIWGNCTHNWTNAYSENIHTIPAGTTVYLRVWYGDTNNAPGIFEVCVYERPCKAPSIGLDEVLACDGFDEYYTNLHLYDMGDATSLTIFNTGGAPAISNITTTGSYSIGPLPIDMETNVTIQHNQSSICTTTLSVYGPYTGGTFVPNDEPCTATDLTGNFGGTYSYTERTNNRSTVRICDPIPPSGGCMSPGFWNNTRVNESVWFSITAPPSGSFTMEMTTEASIALWEASDCNAITTSTPVLTYALSSCYQNPFTHTLRCLNPGETYYLQVVDAYEVFDISLQEIVQSCDPITNDACVDAIPITVESAVCTNATTYSNEGATDSSTDPIPAPTTYNFGTDVWFSSIVPASGNLAMVFEIADNCHCEGRVTFYSGTCDALVEINNGVFYHGEDAKKLLFQNLPGGETIYYRVDFNNNQSNAGYFKMCVLDPPCLPIHWTNQVYIACDDSDQVVVDVVIENLQTATHFDIINPDNGVPYYSNLTAIGSYRLGFFDRTQSVPFQIIHENSFCNEEPFYSGFPSDLAVPPNDDMCTAISLNPIINDTPGNFTGFSATPQDCDPIAPITGCGTDDGWSTPDINTSTWTYFDATSNNMALAVASTEGHATKIAVWKASSCSAIQEGAAIFVKANEPCTNVAQLSFNTLEIGSRYYVQAVVWGAYQIELTSAPATCVPPSGLSVTAISDVAATLNWEAVSLASGYSILYRPHNTNDAWEVASNVQSPLTITGLMPTLTYEWSVQSLCENAATISSPYAGLVNFTTAEAIPTNCTPSLVINDNPIVTATYPAITITSAGIVNPDALVIFHASESITLQSGFHAMAGSDFTAKIGPCSLSAIVPEMPIAATNRTTLSEQQVRLPKTEQVQLQVLPNPMQADATIRFYLPVAGAATIRVVDINGQLLTEESITSAKGWNATSLTANQLQAGMYYIVLQTVDGVWTEKVMVVR